MISNSYHCSDPTLAGLGDRMPLVALRGYFSTSDRGAPVPGGEHQVPLVLLFQHWGQRLMH